MLAIQRMTLLVLMFWFGVNTLFSCSKLDSTTEITPLETDIDVSNQTDDSTCIDILVWCEYIV